MNTDPRPPLGPSRLVRWCLRALMPRAEADAVMGDLNEEVDGRGDDTPHGSEARPIRLEWRAWRYVSALLPVATRRTSRSLWHVVRDASRSVRASPGATVGIVLILALAIAAATVTFSVVDTVVLRPLPFEDDHELVVIGPGSTRNAASVPRRLSALQYLRLRGHMTALDSLAATVVENRITLKGGGDPELLVSAQTTSNLFETLGVRPLLGQTFTTEHEKEGNHHVAVISYSLWQRRFGGDPRIIGRPMLVTVEPILGGDTTDESFVVLGVMPRGFTYPLSTSPELWTPHVMRIGPGYVTDAEGGTVALLGSPLRAVGRLRPGSSLERAQFEATTFAASLSEAEPRQDAYDIHVVPLKDTVLGGDVRGWMLLVLGAVAVVMLIACVNVANLQLVRATRRARELSIRAALGASRRQLLTSLLVESLLLSLIAAGLAVAAATWGIQVAKAALPASLARVSEIGLDLRVLTATISAAIITGLLFGVVPAWQVPRGDLVCLSKQGTMTLGAGRRRWNAGFIVAEVAFVSVLLVGATLIISSFIRVTTADLGFDRSNLLYVSGDTGITEAARIVSDRLHRLPGVAAVRAVELGSPPLAASGFRSGGASIRVVRAAAAAPDTEPVLAEFRGVSTEYFAAAGIPVLSGRVFNDDAVGPNTIVIDERVAEALFGHREAVGSEIDVLSGRGHRRTVVGVVRHVSLSGPERTSVPQVYLPFGSDETTAPFMLTPGFLVRTSAPPATVIPAIRAAFPSAVTSGTNALQIRPLEDAFRNLTAERRFNAGLMSIFGMIAIVIGAAGVYAVLASVVAQQTREMAVRVALGATTSRIVTSVVTQAGRYLIAGLAIGLAVAWWASQSIAAILYGVQPTDASVYATVAAVMIAVGVLAACIPAWRASRVDPLIALRSE